MRAVPLRPRRCRCNGRARPSCRQARRTPPAAGTATLDDRTHVSLLSRPATWPDATDAFARSTPDVRDRLDRPLRDLRLSVIDACNYRCPYCMPADKVGDDHGLDAASR